ncbi:MAG: NUDIX domain-containing protein [Candidatus Dojkabacteria bacterium]|nr:MAG: NUDIX domain-containing protein [Candidatus Dojkabacteria bacterium]
MDNIYKASPKHPSHLSIGAIVINQQNQVLCNHYSKFGHLEDIYTLMTQTHQPGLTIEQSVAAGLKEEFGIEPDLSAMSYLGTKTYKDKWFAESPTMVEKTVVYLLVRVGDDVQPVVGADNTEEVTAKWIEINELVKKMQEQGIEHGVSYLDESAMLKLAVN